MNKFVLFVALLLFIPRATLATDLSQLSDKDRNDVVRALISLKMDCILKKEPLCEKADAVEKMFKSLSKKEQPPTTNYMKTYGGLLLGSFEEAILQIRASESELNNIDKQQGK